MLTTRSLQKEWIDLGPSHYTLDEYRDCLIKLDQVGRFLGGDRASWWAFNQLPTTPQSILDVGCGGGLFTMRLAEHYPQAHVIGIDLSPEAIAFAQLQAKQTALKNVSFLIPESAELHYPAKSFDIVTSTLVCHHLTDQELIHFLKHSYRIAKQAVILNDLHRHVLALGGFACLSPLLFFNRLITHDGLLSIRRAFKYADWVRYLQEAGIPLDHCSITWHWAFRWIVMIHCKE